MKEKKSLLFLLRFLVSSLRDTFHLKLFLFAFPTKLTSAYNTPDHSDESVTEFVTAKLGEIILRTFDPLTRNTSMFDSKTACYKDVGRPFKPSKHPHYETTYVLPLLKQKMLCHRVVTLPPFLRSEYEASWLNFDRLERRG